MADDAELLKVSRTSIAEVMNADDRLLDRTQVEDLPRPLTFRDYFRAAKFYGVPSNVAAWILWSRNLSRDLAALMRLADALYTEADKEAAISEKAASR